MRHTDIGQQAVDVLSRNFGELTWDQLRDQLFARRGHLPYPGWLDEVAADARISVYQRESAAGGSDTFVWRREPVQSKDVVSFVDGQWHPRDGYVVCVRSIHRKTREFLAASRESAHVPLLREFLVEVENRAIVAASRVALTAF